MSGAIPPLLQYAFMAWCLVKHRDNFTFTFLPLPVCSVKVRLLTSYITFTYHERPPPNSPNYATSIQTALNTESNDRISGSSTDPPWFGSINYTHFHKIYYICIQFYTKHQKFSALITKFIACFINSVPWSNKFCCLFCYSDHNFPGSLFGKWTVNMQWVTVEGDPTRQAYGSAMQGVMWHKHGVCKETVGTLSELARVKSAWVGRVIPMEY